jgi:hypothetical protein
MSALPPKADIKSWPKLRLAHQASSANEIAPLVAVATSPSSPRSFVPHLRRRRGCGASLFRVGALELATQKPW